MIQRGDIIEVSFKAYKVLDASDKKLMVEDSTGSRKSILNTDDINILQRVEETSK